MHFSLVKRGWRGMFSFDSIARVHPLFVFKYFFYTSKSDDITTFAFPLFFLENLEKRKILNIDISNLDETVKNQLRGLIKYFNGEMNNIAVQVQER